MYNVLAQDVQNTQSQNVQASPNNNLDMARVERFFFDGEEKVVRTEKKNSL